MVYKVTARPSTSKKITTVFISLLAFLQWSGTKPTESPQSACTEGKGSVRWRGGNSRAQGVGIRNWGEWSRKEGKADIGLTIEVIAVGNRDWFCRDFVRRVQNASWSYLKCGRLSRGCPLWPPPQMANRQCAASGGSWARREGVLWK